MKKFKKANLISFLGQDTDKLVFVGNRRDLMNLRTCQNVVIAGSLGLVTMDPNLNPGSDLIQQETRSCRSPFKRLLAQLQKKKIKDLHLWIDKAVFDKQRELKKPVKWMCCHDYYLSWGLRQKPPTILLGGYADDSGVNIEVYRFSNQTLREVQEYEMEAPGAFRFDDDLTEKIVEWKKRFLDYRIVWAKPLPWFEFLESHVEDIDDEPFKIKPLQGIYQEDKARTQDFRLKLAIIAICLIAVAGYVGVIGLKWKGYKRAYDHFLKRSSPYADTYQNQDGCRELLEAKKRFLERERPETKRVAFLLQLTKSLTQIPGASGIIIKKVSVEVNPQAMRSDGSKAFVTVFQVPQSPANAWDQAKPIIDRLSEQLGCAVYISKHRSAEIKVLGQNVPYREFVVQGIIPDATPS